MQNVSNVRVVLKPMGVASVLLALTVLTGLLVLNMRSKASGTAAAAPPSGPAAGSVSNIPTSSPTGALLPTALEGWALDANPPAEASKELIDDPTVPNLEKRIVRAKITRVAPNAFWEVQFKRMVEQEIPNNTPLVLRFIARSTTRNQIQAVFLLNQGDYPKDLNASVSLTPEWKVYTFPFTTKRLYRGSEAAVILHLGKNIGEIDLAALQVYPADRVPK